MITRLRAFAELEQRVPSVGGGTVLEQDRNLSQSSLPTIEPDERTGDAYRLCRPAWTRIQVARRPYRWLYGCWLVQSGEEPDNAPTVEEYLNDARMVPTELRTEIWLPIRW